MNKLGWFMCGNFLMGIFMALGMSYLEVGEPNSRSLALIVGVVGIGIAIITQSEVKE